MHLHRISSELWKEKEEIAGEESCLGSESRQASKVLCSAL